MNKKLEKLTKSDQIIISEFVDQLVNKLNDKLVFVQLFGSRARGEARPNSDIDIMIVVKKKERFFDEINDIVTDLELDFLEKNNVFFSSMIYSLEEYERLSDLTTNFMYWLQKEGITLWPLKNKAA